MGKDIAFIIVICFITIVEVSIWATSIYVGYISIKGKDRVLSILSVLVFLIMSFMIFVMFKFLSVFKFV